MTEDENQREKVSASLSVSYEVKPFTREDKDRVVKAFLKYFIVSFVIIIAVILSVFYILLSFPDFVRISTAENLLNIMIQTDGILFGFVGIIFAQLLSSIMSSQDVLFKNLIEKPEQKLNKAYVDFLDYRKSSLTFIVVLTFGALLASIVLSMLIIAGISQYQPTDTYSTFNILFTPFLFTFVAMVFLILTFAILPTKPPMGEKK